MEKVRGCFLGSPQAGSRRAIQFLNHFFEKPAPSLSVCWIVKLGGAVLQCVVQGSWKGKELKDLLTIFNCTFLNVCFLSTVCLWMQWNLRSNFSRRVRKTCARSVKLPWGLGYCLYTLFCIQNKVGAIGSFSLYIAHKNHLLIVGFMDAMATLNAVKELSRFLAFSDEHIVWNCKQCPSATRSKQGGVNSESGVQLKRMRKTYLVEHLFVKAVRFLAVKNS